MHSETHPLSDTTSAELKLTSLEQEQWREEGYFIRADQFTAAELTILREAAESAAARADQETGGGDTYFLDNKRFVNVGPSTVQYEYETGSNTVRVLEPVHLYDERIDHLIDDERLSVPMQELVGSETLALWTAKLNLKRAAGSAFGWHQDSPYWIHDCAHVDQLPNVMLALDDQSETNGCFRVIRGSHKQGILPGTDDGTQLGGFYTDPASFSLEDDVPMNVSAGGLIFFNPHTVHGSQPNTSRQPRRALIFTYQPGNCPMLKNGEVRNVATHAESR